MNKSGSEEENSLGFITSLLKRLHCKTYIFFSSAVE